MKQSLLRIATISLTLAPFAAFAHPGHADGAPLMHELSHAPHYVIAALAVGIFSAQQLRRWWSRNTAKAQG